MELFKLKIALLGQKKVILDWKSTLSGRSRLKRASQANTRPSQA